MAGFLQAYALPWRWNRGPESRWWEHLRRVVSRALGRLSPGAGPRPIAETEYAGSAPASLDETEQLLYERGFVRNPTARLKTRNGVPEDGSWVYRESPLAPRQLHIMLFERGDGDTDFYAHEELSSVHPFCSRAHFDGTGQSVRAGVRRTREWFALDASDAPENPPDGPWNA